MIGVESLVIGGEGVACKEMAEKTKEIDCVEMESELIVELSFKKQVNFPFRIVVWAME